jgi:hypothetical protein
MVFVYVISVYDGSRVVTSVVMPAQEQAEAYRTEPEHADAYEGTWTGVGASM